MSASDHLSPTQFPVEHLSSMPSGEFDGAKMSEVHGLFKDYYSSGAFDAQDQHDEQQALTTSVAKEGVREPIKVSRKNGVIDGHHRYMAAVDAGLTHVPLRYED